MVSAKSGSQTRWPNKRRVFSMSVLLLLCCEFLQVEASGHAYHSFLNIRIVQQVTCTASLAA